MDRSLLESLRPAHWVKQVFVFPGVVFSGKLLEPPTLLRVLAAAGLFCLASSSGYLLNDLLNRPEDQANTRTAHRPIARGELSEKRASRAAFFLAVFSVILALPVGVVWEVFTYLAASTLYSAVFKKVALLDLASLVFMYLTRLLAGCTAAAVPPSPWLLLCGGSLALLLSWGKRVGEKNTPYPSWLLRGGLAPLGCVTTLLYLAYTLQPTTRQNVGWGLVLTVPWVGFAIIRYMLLAARGLGDPISALARDRLLAFLAAFWTVHTLLVMVLASP